MSVERESNYGVVRDECSITFLFWKLKLCFSKVSVDELFELRLKELKAERDKDQYIADLETKFDDLMEQLRKEIEHEFAMNGQLGKIITENIRLREQHVKDINTGRRHGARQSFPT